LVLTPIGFQSFNAVYIQYCLLALYLPFCKDVLRYNELVQIPSSIFVFRVPINYYCHVQTMSTGVMHGSLAAKHVFSVFSNGICRA
jgi:hypothetical protein